MSCSHRSFSAEPYLFSGQTSRATSQSNTPRYVYHRGLEDFWPSSVGSNICYGIFQFYLLPAGDINLHHVCEWECVLRACVCHAVFSKTITVRHFLLKKGPNEFSCPRIFFGFIHFELKLSE